MACQGQYFHPKSKAMKKYMFYLLGGLMVIAGLALFLYQCEPDPTEMQEMDALATQNNGPDRPVPTPLCTCINDYPMGKLSSNEREILMFMREEEKMALDVYTTLHRKWDINSFDIISRAEQNHLDALRCLLYKYQLSDPIGSNPPGVYANPEIQRLYKELMQEGMTTKKGAYLAGTMMEDHDIARVTNYRPQVDNEDILKVMDELNKASRNHMKAFTNNLLKNYNVVYAPVYINTRQYQQIINGPWEPGSAFCDIYLYNIKETDLAVE
jgi:hypothetical protein